MNRTWPLALALAISVALPLAAADPPAAPAKPGPRPALAIVTVDYNKVMGGCKYAQRLQARLQGLDESIRKQLEPMVKEFREKQAAFQTDATSMPPEQRSKEEADLKMMEQRLNIIQQQAQQAYSQQRDALAQKMRDFLVPVVEALSKERGWDMVLSRTGNDVVWAGSAVDASDLLVERLNAVPMPADPDLAPGPQPTETPVPAAPKSQDPKAKSTH